VAVLRDAASSYDWVAATVGANSAAGVQLATREPVMAIGGFNGTDPAPTLAQFQQLVAAGRVHYFLAAGRGGGLGGAAGSGPAAEITRWVEQTFTPQRVGGTTLYDLTATAANNGGSFRTT
jgi:4-amino-4-deoxy-L-arabinose transferase-like glycosyltransferase